MLKVCCTSLRYFFIISMAGIYHYVFIDSFTQNSCLFRELLDKTTIIWHFLFKRNKGWCCHENKISDWRVDLFGVV